MKFNFKSRIERRLRIAEIIKKNFLNKRIYLLIKVLGERRGLNPRVLESQSNALPLGYARHFKLFKKIINQFNKLKIF